MTKWKCRISYGYFVSDVFIEIWLKIVIALGHILAHTIVKMQVRVSVTKYWVITVIQLKRQKQFIRQVRQWHFVMIWPIFHATNKVKLIFYMIRRNKLELHCSQNHEPIFSLMYSACSVDSEIHFTWYIRSHDLHVNLLEWFCSFFQAYWTVIHSHDTVVRMPGW